MILSRDTTKRDSALKSIYLLDEEAIAPLIDEFYAGVNEQTGVLILEIISKIGGYEARQLLTDIADSPQPYPSWCDAATDGLTQNGWLPD
ncbi:MAG: hypothetical protein RLP44_30395 [Aggregatilineales bacterium]